MKKFNEFQLIGDWLKNLIERAIEIQTDNSDYKEGLQQGYYECISHILNQIDGLNLMDNLNDEYLKNFKPEDIIIGTAKNPYKE